MASSYPVAGPHLGPASGCQVLHEHICHQGLEHRNAKFSQLELSREHTISLLPLWHMGLCGTYPICGFPRASFQDILLSLPRFCCHVLLRNICLDLLPSSNPFLGIPKGQCHHLGPDKPISFLPTDVFLYHSLSCSLSFLAPCPLVLHDGVSLLSPSHTSFSVSSLCPELPPSCHLAADICHIFPTQAPTFSWRFSQEDVNFHSDFSQDLIMYTEFSTRLNNYFSTDSRLHCLS